MYAAQIELFVYSLLGLLLAVLFCVEVARRYSQLGSAGPALVVFSFCCSVFFGYAVAASFERDVEDDPNSPRIEAMQEERFGRILLWISFVLGSLLLFCDVWVGYGTAKFIAI